jgi:Raf kinase inhibitor-like YbhB/YbcL family protein
MRYTNKFAGTTAVSVAGMTLLAVSAFAQGQNAGGDGPPVLAEKIAVPSGSSPRLFVTSGGFNSGEALNDKYTQNGDNMSPSLSWSKGPLGTQSYVVLAEDSGVNRHDPIVHWVLYNIPSNITSLGQNIPIQAHLDMGAEQGKNVRGSAGYVGPKPPAGQTHPYHFEVFALNTKLNLDPANADRQAVLNAMKTSVLASGEIVANYTGK